MYLQIPNHFVWLCFFYVQFHSIFNLIGELLHFADRNFYCDWWNANNTDTFWRTWNMPVHRWCVRHVYIPMVDMGYNRSVASLFVFFISAFFHEYLVNWNLLRQHCSISAPFFYVVRIEENGVTSRIVAAIASYSPIWVELSNSERINRSRRFNSQWD